MDRHQQMEVFATVAQTRSLAAAARQLALSTATATRAVDALEARLGATLLLRSTRGVQLSEAGQRFALECRQLLDALALAEASAAGLHARPAGLLTLAAPLLLGEQLLTPLALRFLQQHPQVQLRLSFMDHLPNLQLEGIDVGLVVGALADSSLHALRLGQIQRVLVASREYLERAGEPTRPEQLRLHTLIHSQEDSRLPEWQFSDCGELIRVAFKPRLVVTTDQAALQAVRRGAGLARCMSFQVREELASGQLVRMLPGHEPAPLVVSLLYRGGSKAAARVRSFVDFAADRLRQALAG